MYILKCLMVTVLAFSPIFASAQDSAGTSTMRLNKNEKRTRVYLITGAGVGAVAGYLALHNSKDPNLLADFGAVLVGAGVGVMIGSTINLMLKPLPNYVSGAPATNGVVAEVNF